MKLDHFSQLNIDGEHMQHNEWGQNQGDKWKYFRCPEQFFDVVRHQRHYHNRRENCGDMDKCEFEFRVLERNFLDKFKTAFRICVSKQFIWELLFTEQDLQNISVSY